MLTTQIGSPSPQTPLAVIGQSLAEDWLRVGVNDREVAASESALAASEFCSQIPLVFLRRLVVDDRLRIELEMNAADTLARHGIHVAADEIPTAVVLPSAEELEGALRIYATAEDESMIRRWGGFLGGLIDNEELFGD